MSNSTTHEGLRWLAGQLAWERRLVQLQENADFAQAIGQELPVRYAAVPRARSAPRRSPLATVPPGTTPTRGNRPCTIRCSTRARTPS